MRVLLGLCVTIGAVSGCAAERPRAEGPRVVTVEREQRPTAPRAGTEEREPRVQVPGGGSCGDVHARITQDNLREAEIAVRCLTNAARRKQGLPELAFSEPLARAAATRSNDMAEANFFGHDGPGDSSVQVAVGRTGWIPSDKSWLLGENIGWAGAGGQGATPARLMRSWLDSPTHRENIMAPHFTEMGVGAVAAVPKKGAGAGATYTQVFGVRGPGARDPAAAAS